MQLPNMLESITTFSFTLYPVFYHQKDGGLILLVGRFLLESAGNVNHKKVLTIMQQMSFTSRKFFHI